MRFGANCALAQRLAAGVQLSLPGNWSPPPFGSAGSVGGSVMDRPVLENFDWAAREREFGETLCASPYCNTELRQTPHPAQWWAIAKCGDILPICEQRRRLCRSAGGWYCEPGGCGKYHAYRRIRFYPVKPRN